MGIYCCFIDVYITHVVDVYVFYSPSHMSIRQMDDVCMHKEFISFAPFFHGEILDWMFRII